MCFAPVFVCVCVCVSILDVFFFAVVAGFVRCLQPVLVSRQDPDSRKNTIQEIDKRAKSEGRWPQVCQHNTSRNFKN